MSRLGVDASCFDPKLVHHRAHRTGILPHSVAVPPKHVGDGHTYL